MKCFEKMITPYSRPINNYRIKQFEFKLSILNDIPNNLGGGTFPQNYYDMLKAIKRYYTYFSQDPYCKKSFFERCQKTEIREPGVLYGGGGGASI